MPDVSKESVLKNIKNLFNRSCSVHKYSTQSSAMGNYYAREIDCESLFVLISSLLQHDFSKQVLVNSY